MNISGSVKEQFNMPPSNQNMDFWVLPTLGLKKFKKIRGFGLTIEKKYQCTKNPGARKKQKMTPQTIHILAYKNAIANGLRTTQKLPIQNVEQFDDMIRHNDNPMNNNFWHLFIQLISQLA